MKISVMHSVVDTMRRSPVEFLFLVVISTLIFCAPLALWLGFVLILFTAGGSATTTIALVLLAVSTIVIFVLANHRIQLRLLRNSGFDLRGAGFSMFVAVSAMVSLAVTIGFQLFIVPGLLAYSRLCLAPLIMIHRPVTIADAFRISWKQTANLYWQLMAISGLLGGAYFAIVLIWLPISVTSSFSIPLFAIGAIISGLHLSLPVAVYRIVGQERPPAGDEAVCEFEHA